MNAEDRTRVSSYFLTGTVAPEIMSALRLYRLDLATPILSARRNEIYHARRDRKADMGNAVSWADIERIPDIIERPKAVLFDIEKGNRLVYVFEPLGGDGRLGKLVFWVNWQEKRRGITNSFRTAGYVERYNLTDQRYVRLGGNLDKKTTKNLIDNIKKMNHQYYYHGQNGQHIMAVLILTTSRAD